MKFKLQKILADQSNSIKAAASELVIIDQHTVMIKFPILCSASFDDIPQNFLLEVNADKCSP